jgi:hypothetical protein
MNKFTQYLLIVFLLNIVGSLEAQAATLRSSNCSNSAVQSAINSASNGDTVIIPTGNCVWSDSVIIPSTKGIILQGSGSIDSNGNYSSTGTVIDLGTNSLIARTKSSGNSPVRITGFYFKHSTINSGSAGAIIMEGQTGGYRTGSTNWRIDHNFFEYTKTGSQTDPAVHIKGWTYGLIDHNVMYHQGRAIFHEMGNDDWEPTYGKDFYGDGSWDTDLGGPIDWGGPKAVYVENNWMIGKPEQYLDPDQLYDSHWGTRIVFRYNTVTDMYIMTHSGSNNHGRSALQVEAYENDFYTTTYSGMSVVLRTFILQGGTFVIYNNRMHGKPRNNALQVQYPPACYGAGGAPTAYTYPCTYGVNCIDTIGTGPDSSHSGVASEPAYAWGNTVDGSPVYFTIGACNNGEIQIGRDVIHATKPGYSPYTYPHPLINQSSSTTGGSSTADGLSAPSGLRVVK